MKTKLPGYDEALKLVLAHAPVLRVERLALAKTPGRVLTEDVRADRDQPPFNRSAMDGFAVRSAEIRAGESYVIAGGVAAGASAEHFEQPMPARAVKRIATGAPLPVDADAVIPIEQASADDTSVRFLIPTIEPWKNVHRRASDAKVGDVVLSAGTRVGPQHVGIAAAVGATELTVVEQPRITLLTTGDEVVDPSILTQQLQPQQIRNSNGPMLGAWFAAMNTPVLDHVHIEDEPEPTLAAAREALSRSHLVVTVGGVSVGQRDHMPAAWEQLGLTTVVHGVAIQPGKPVLVARLPEADQNKLVIGLPGNPVSVLATAHLFVLPVLRKMLGMNITEGWREHPLSQGVKGSSKREVFRAGKLEADGSVRVIVWHGSGDLMHTAGADCFVRLPLSDEMVPAGTKLPVLMMVK